MKPEAISCRKCFNVFQKSVDEVFKITPFTKVVDIVSAFGKDIELYMNRVNFDSRKLTEDERKDISKLLSHQKKILSNKIKKYNKEVSVHDSYKNQGQKHRQRRSRIVSRKPIEEVPCVCGNIMLSIGLSCGDCRVAMLGSVDKVFNKTKITRAIYDVTEFNSKIEIYMDNIDLQSETLAEEEREKISKYLLLNVKLLSDRIKKYNSGGTSS